ncbi:MAG: response regulator [Ilumatobacter sp.]
MIGVIESSRHVDVMVVDDHQMMLDGLRSGLDGRERLRVIATAASVAAARQHVEAVQPDVIVADLQLPDGSGLDVCRLAGDAATIIITGLERHGLVRDVVAAGARGLLKKSAPITELAAAISVVAEGGTTFSAHDLRTLTAPDTSHVGATLTPREREVLELLAGAATAEAIAIRLNLSIHTVRTHIAGVLTKLHATSQLEAVVIAQRSGLV